MKVSKTIKIRLKKSGIGYAERQKKTLVGLGLTRMHKIVEFKNTPAIQGMIRKVSHLVEIIG